ncbi:hypothetical protein Tco_1238170 [Tanacetum coccineum]
MDKYKTGLGYNAVPPPYTGNFMPPKSDLVYPSLDDFVDVNESQFWAIANVKTVNGEVQIQALVDKKKVIITKTSVKSDLQLEDAEGKRLSGRTHLIPTYDWLKLRTVGEYRRNRGKDMGSSTLWSSKPVMMILKMWQVVPTLSMAPCSVGLRRGGKLMKLTDAEVTLVDETQGRYGDNLMFDTGVLDNEQDMAEKEVDMAEKDVRIMQNYKKKGQSDEHGHEKEKKSAKSQKLCYQWST